MFLSINSYFIFCIVRKKKRNHKTNENVINMWHFFCWYYSISSEKKIHRNPNTALINICVYRFTAFTNLERSTNGTNNKQNRAPEWFETVWVRFWITTTLKLSKYRERERVNSKEKSKTCHAFNEPLIKTVQIV